MGTMNTIPVQTEGYLTNTANSDSSFVRITGHQILENRLYHQFTFILKDGSAYGGGLVDIDSDRFVFEIDDGEEEAVCADHE